MRSTVLGIGTVALVATIALAACSSDAATSGSTGSTPGSAASIITVGPTAFETVAPTVITIATTTTVVVLAPGTIIPSESTYTIQSGDYPSTVATKFKVDLQALLDLNGFELKNNQVPAWPLPGSVIKIPAGATVPGESTSTDVPTGTDGTNGTGGAAPTTAAVPTTVDVCAESSYVIVAGDVPSTVAAKFDTTVDALAAANVNTKGYDNFVVGITIKIPAKTNC